LASFAVTNDFYFDLSPDPFAAQHSNEIVGPCHRNIIQSDNPISG
jgi:hypothetical protein